MIIPFTLRTISPLHIGNGDKLYHNVDFVVDQGAVHILDDRKLVGILGPKVFSQMLKEIQRNGNLKDFLERVANQTWRNAIKRRLVFDTQLAGAEMAPFITDGYGKLYIPGSSLKGSLMSILGVEMAEKVNLKSNDLKYRDRFSDGVMVKKTAGNTIEDQFNRFFKITDCYFEEQDSAYYDMGVMNRYGGADQEGEWDFKRGQRMGLEIVPNKVNASGKLKLDEAMLSANMKRQDFRPQWPKEWITDPIAFMAVLKKSFKATLQKELDFWNDGFNSDDEALQDYINAIETIFNLSENCNEKQSYIKIGSGQGYDFITSNLIHSLEDAGRISNSVRKELIKNLRRRDYGDIPFPKTRKMNADGIPLGFVKMSLEI